MQQQSNVTKRTKAKFYFGIVTELDNYFRSVPFNSYCIYCFRLSFIYTPFRRFTCYYTVSFRNNIFMEIL